MKAICKGENRKPSTAMTTTTTATTKVIVPNAIHMFMNRGMCLGSSHVESKRYKISSTMCLEQNTALPMNGLYP